MRGLIARIGVFGLVAAAGCASLTPLNVRRAEDRREIRSGVLERAIAAPDPSLRVRAALAMGRIQSPEYVPALRIALADSDAGVRSAAAFALGQTFIDVSSAAPVSPEAAASLESILADADPGVRAAAAEALGKVGGPQAQERLVELLSGPEPALRREAATGLFRLRYLRRIPEYSTSAARVLLSGLDDADAEIRWRSAYAFSRWPEPEAAGALAASTVRPEAWTRLFAFRALAQIKLEALSVPVSGWNRDESIKDAVTAAARRGLSDSDPKVVAEALAALRSFGRADLIGADAARSSSPHVRTAAARALQNPEGDISLLLLLAKDPSPMVRAEAVESLARRQGDAFRTELQPFLRDPSWWVRSRAAAAGEFLPKQGFPVLEGGLHDDDVRVREAAVEALGHRSGGLADELIEQILEDPDAPLEVRGAAVDAAAERKSAALLLPLETAYRRSMGRAFVELREDAVDAAAAMAGADPGDKAVAAFQEEFLGDPAPSVRIKAAGALHRPAPPLPRPEASRYLDEPPSQSVLVLETEKGDIVVQLSTEAAPIHSRAIASAAARGVYQGTPWHRVVTNFVIQGGDPRGTGWGDAGESLRDEINRTRFDRGVVGMPKAGKDTGGCQIFITLVPTPHLDGRYTAFGRVVSGMDVADRIEPGDRILRAYLR